MGHVYFYKQKYKTVFFHQHLDILILYKTFPVVVSVQLLLLNYVDLSVSHSNDEPTMASSIVFLFFYVHLFIPVFIYCQ